MIPRLTLYTFLTKFYVYSEVKYNKIMLIRKCCDYIVGSIVGHGTRLLLCFKKCAPYWLI